MKSKLKASDFSSDFESLYRRYYHAVRMVIAGFRFTAATADDLLQDVFLQAWQHFPSLRDHAAFSGWLMSITRNRCLNELARNKVTARSTSGVAIDDEGMGVFLVAEDDYAALYFEHSLTLLRQLIEMHEGEPRASIAKKFYLEQKSIREIADELSIKQNTVLSHLRRFRLVIGQSLLQLLEEKGI